MIPNQAILKQHKQIHEDSCIPMSVEYVLKELQIVPINFFDYQKDDSKHKVLPVWVEQIHKEKIVFKREVGLASNEILNRVDTELEVGHMVIISLQWAPQKWHMYVIVEKRGKDGNYNVVTSTPGSSESWIEVKDLECRIPKMNGVDLITYQLI